MKWLFTIIHKVIPHVGERAQLGKKLIKTNNGLDAWALSFFYEFIWGPKNMNSY